MSLVSTTYLLFIIFATVVHSAPWSGLPAGKVLFGQSAPFSGGSWEPAPAFNLGLLSAFREINVQGGVYGRQLELLSLDDQYNATKTASNVQQLVTNPDVFALLATMGSATSVAAMDIASPIGIPLLGPLTGALAFRQPFQEQVINLRASYTDEAINFVRFMVTDKQFKRISLIFIDDVCCRPVRDAVVEAMQSIKLKLTSIHPYKTSEYANINYEQFAADVWQHRPQGIMMFCVPGFSTQFLEAMYKIQTYPITYVTSSFVGDAPREYLQAHPHLDQTQWFTTQISPHPMSDTPLTNTYRAAMIAQNGPSVKFDFLSLEGYMVGRLVVEALRRTPILTRENFIKSFYSTKLFSIDNLLAGPYSNDCVHDPGTAVGHSSLCKCNTGLRFVSVTGINEKYEYTDAGVDLVFPMTECSATRDSVARPILLSNVYRNASDVRSTAERLRLGMALDKSLHAIAKPLPIDDSVGEALSAVETVANNHPLLGVVGGMDVAQQDTLPVFPVYGKLPIHDRVFHRETIHLFATIQQQIYVASYYISEKTSSNPTYVLLSESASTLATDDDITLRKMCENSFESYRLSGIQYRTFSSATLRSELSAIPTTGVNVLIYGITTAADMTLVVDAMETAPEMEVFMAFNEIMAHNTVLEARYPVAAGPNATSNRVPARLHVATNLPEWSGRGEFARNYQRMMKDANLEANITDPAFFVGYFMSRVLQLMITRTNGDASPSAFLEEIYRTSVVSLDGMSLGPYIAEQCTNEDCLCNSGARVVDMQTVSGFRYGTAPVVSTRFSKCHVQYQLIPPVAKSYTVAVVVGIVVPMVAIGGLIVAAVFITRHLKVANAPKDISKFHTMFVQLKKETLLWERHGHVMPQLMNEYHSIVKQAVKANKCYLVKHIGGATLIAATTSDQILGCAGDVNRALQNNDWSKLVSEKQRRNHASHNGSETSKTSRNSKNSKNSRNKSTCKVERLRSDASLVSASRSSQERPKENSSVKESTSYSRDRSLSADGTRNTLSETDHVRFSIGVHYDSGVITYHEDRHTYDYSGPVVDGAAIAADKARGDQILVTGKVSQKGIYSDSFMEFCTSEWGKGIVLHQFNVAGMPVRFFSNEDSGDDTNVDSIAATLEQQSAGVTNKRVVVASIFLNSIQEKAASMPHSGFARHLTSKLGDIRQIVKEHKGHIHSLFGPRLTITFNAVSPTPQSTMRACNVIEEIKELEAKDHATITAGIASETSLVGSLQIEDWKLDAINSKVGETAALLQRMCDNYNDAHCLAQQSMYDELNCFTVVEYVDLVRLPDTAKPRLLISLHGFKEEQDSDEWMYELENAAAGNPYFGANEIFDRAAHEGEAYDELKTRLDALPVEARNFSGHPNLSKLVDSFKTASDSHAAIETYLSDGVKKM